MMDFSSYTNEELATLQNQVINELNARKSREMENALGEVEKALRKLFDLGGSVIINGTVEDDCEIFNMDDIGVNYPNGYLYIDL